MNKSLCPHRDFAALEARRFQAAALFSRGRSQAFVARQLGVSRTSALRWHRLWKLQGRVALRGAGRAGRKSRLTAAACAQLTRVLVRGARAAGFATEVWTLHRVATVIRRVCRVRYHPRHVWRVLRSLGWSRQRPARRAQERDEEAIARWVRHRWPAVKKTPAA